MTRVGIALAMLLAPFLVLSVGATPAAAGGAQLQADQKALLQQLGVRNFGGVVVDSAMTYQQALGDSVVPPKEYAVHAAIKPYLRVVPVAYWGLGSDGLPDNRIHVGQIVVHRLLVADTTRVFARMFLLRFPVHSVIPHSAFGYDDSKSMAANNSSAYRPDSPSEHSRGAAFDINPVQNPMDLWAYDGTPPEPAGAVYNPAMPGTITMQGAVRLYWSSLGWEWGGNWGNPHADPPTDFFRNGYYDYQHFQLGARDPDRYAEFNAQLPPCLQDWSC